MAQKTKIFFRFSKINNETSISNFVNIINTPELNTGGNGGGWFRSDSSFLGKNYRFIKVTKSGKITYVNFNEFNEIAKEEIEKEVKIYREENKLSHNKGTAIELIKTYGKFNKKNLRPPIKQSIRNYYKNKPCVVCETHSIEVDHKNDLYNDPRVLNIDTQIIDDFQPLCKHCNDKKRNCKEKMLQTNKRYGATNIPQFKHFGIDFIEGDETLDKNDPNTLVGSYWYDPVAFTKGIKKIMKAKMEAEAEIEAKFKTLNI
jgi:hypothetical protein